MTNKSNTKIDQLINHFGNVAKTARALEISVTAVGYWKKGKNGVALKTAIKAEKLTGGKIKAVDLCPDLQGLN